MATRDLVDKAIEMEKMARDYYREAGRKSIQQYVGPALKHMAREEQNHMELLMDYRETMGTDRQVKLPPAGEYDDTWRRFTDALEEVRDGILPHTDEVTVVQRAIGLEEQGLVLYSEAMKQSDSETGRKIFAFLTDQENRHRAYLEDLLGRLLVLTEEPPETRPQL
ncbi:ferritin family protein [bacterium]|nr:ferritin family protein [bacterium]